MDNKKWVSVWGNSITCDEFSPSNYAKDITLRYFITTAVNGEKIKLRFSNTYGYEDVVLTRVTVGMADKDGNVSEIKDVTFGKNKSAKIAKGTYLYSDEIDFVTEFNGKIAVSIYLENYTDMHSAISTAGPLTNNRFCKGDFSGAKAFEPQLSEGTARTYFLDTVEVLASNDCKAAVVFGDSISAQSWPEWLALRLLGENRSDISVVRRAVSGSRVLREYSNLSLLKYAHAGIARFEADISSVKGADRVFVLHGVNDIIHPQEGVLFRPMSDLPTAEDLIAGYRRYIDIAHKYGLKIYIATITPFCNWRTYDKTRNDIRESVNKWIMSCNEADGYIDFAGALCNPEKPMSLLDVYNSKDNLHPSLEGGKALAESVPEDYLK